jgi:cytochrome b
MPRVRGILMRPKRINKQKEQKMNKTNTYYLNTTKSLRKEQHHNPNGLFTVYYSYATPVAFAVNGEITVSENVWSRTTGKHLTQIDGGDKKSRISHDEFEKLYNKAREVLYV